MHHRSSGTYSTLYGFGVLKLPSERTLREYWHVAFAAAAFTKDNDYRTQTLSPLCQYLPCYSKLILQYLGEAKKSKLAIEQGKLFSIGVLNGRCSATNF